MTDVQRQEATARLEKARAAKQTKSPAEYKSVAASVLALPDDDPLSMKNIRQWIKYQQDLALAMRRSDQTAKCLAAESYINSMRAYLLDGVWRSNYWGERGENRMNYVCHAYAYNADGTRKRTGGVFYPDIGRVWGEKSEKNNGHSNRYEESESGSEIGVGA